MNCLGNFYLLTILLIFKGTISHSAELTSSSLCPIYTPIIRSVIRDGQFPRKKLYMVDGEVKNVGTWTLQTLRQGVPTTTTSLRRELKAVISLESSNSLMKKTFDTIEQLKDQGHKISYALRDLPQEGALRSKTITFYGKSVEIPVEEGGVTTMAKAKMRIRYYLDELESGKFKRPGFVSEKGWLEIKVANPSPHEPNAVIKARVLVPDSELQELTALSDLSIPLEEALWRLEKIRQHVLSITSPQKTSSLEINTIFDVIAKMMTQDRNFVGIENVVSYSRRSYEVTETIMENGQEVKYPFQITFDSDVSYHTIQRDQFGKTLIPNNYFSDQSGAQGVWAHYDVLNPLAPNDPQVLRPEIVHYKDIPLVDGRYSQEAIAAEVKIPDILAQRPPEEWTPVQKYFSELYEEMTTSDHAVSGFEVGKGKGANRDRFFEEEI